MKKKISKVVSLFLHEARMEVFERKEIEKKA